MINDILTLNALFTRIKSPYEEAKKIFTYYYAPKYFKAIKIIYTQVNGLYYNRFKENIGNHKYRYNFKNAQRTFLFTAMLIDGFNLSKKKLNPELAIYLLMSAILCDIGLIDKNDETGNNRTDSTINFINRHIDEFQIGEEDADIIGRLIRFTGNMTDEEFFSTSDDEKIAGSILATAYFIERLTDEQFKENLLLLHEEFISANQDNGKKNDDLDNTVEFYETLKRKMVDYSRFHFKHRHQVDRDMLTELMDGKIPSLEKVNC